MSCLLDNEWRKKVPGLWTTTGLRVWTSKKYESDWGVTWAGGETYGRIHVTCSRGVEALGPIVGRRKDSGPHGPFLGFTNEEAHVVEWGPRTIHLLSMGIATFPPLCQRRLSLRAV